MVLTQVSAPLTGLWLRRLREPAIALLPLVLSRIGLAAVGVVALSLWPVQFHGWLASEHAWLDIWARWDSGYYIGIAREGYSFVPGEMSSVAFFPLYSLLMRLVTLGSSQVEPLTAVGWAISNLATALAFWLLYRLICEQEGEALARRTLWVLALFPTSFYLSAVYTEGLFLLLTVAAFWSARRGSWWAAGLLGAASAATRAIGALLALPLVLEWRAREGRSCRSLAWLALAPSGLLAYMAYLYARWGDPLLFRYAQGSWGRNTSLTGAVQTAAEMLTGANLLGRIAAAAAHAPLDLAALLLALVLLVALLRRQRPSYGLYAAYAVGVPILTMQLASMPRYLIVAFPLFIALARLLRRRWVLVAALALSATLQLYLFVRWVLWYWVA